MMRKNEWILTSIFFGLVVILGIYAWTSSQGEKEKPKNKSQTSTKANEQKNNDNQQTLKDVQQLFYQNNQGKIGKNYTYDQHHSLIVTQTSNISYSDAYAGNKVLWVEKKAGKIQTKELNEGTNLVGIATENKKAYWEIEGRIFFIYYEHIRYPSSGYSYNEKGYVYEINDEGTIQKKYETKGSFDSIERNKNGTVILKERVYQDEKNSYPMAFKPYELHYLQFQDGKWNVMKKEMIHPEVEQFKKEEKELQKNRGPQNPYQTTS